MNRIRYWLNRLVGPCPFWHTTTDRVLEPCNGCVFYRCAECQRVTSRLMYCGRP